MALKWLRDNLRHLKFVLWGVVIVFVLLVFVDWGSGQAGLGGRGDAAVKIGSREVGEQEFVAQVKRVQDYYQSQLGDNWEQFKNQIDLGQQAVQQIVERHLLLDETERVGLVVSAEELQDEILSMPIFSTEKGSFIGQDKYRQVLRANRTSPQEFEAGLREELLLAKLRSMILDGVWVSDAEVEESIRREGDSAEVRAVQLRYERYLADVAVDETEASDYFAANGESFAREEERVIRYLVVETNKLRQLLEVDETELLSYYEAKQEDFREGEQVQASHVLIRLGPDASESDAAAAQLKADQVGKLARGGADFATLAETHSEDPGSKANGGDLGWFGRGRMMKEFEDAVFAGKPGEILGPVKSQFGYHIIKVVGYRPDRVRPFDEVKDDVRFRYLESQAAGEAETRAGLLAKRLTTEQVVTNEAWQLIADEDDSVVLNESPPVEAGGTIPGMGSDPEFVERVFAAEEGQIGGPRPIPRGWIVWQVKEIRLAGVPPFEEVRDEVEQELRRAGAMKIALERAALVASAWREGEDIDELASSNDTTVVEAKDHRRGGAFGALGVLPTLDAEVFRSSTGAVIGPVEISGRGAVVAGVDQLSLVDELQIEAQRSQVRQRLTAERAGLLLTSIINERRRETVVTVNNELLARFSPQG